MEISLLYSAQYTAGAKENRCDAKGDFVLQFFPNIVYLTSRIGAQVSNIRYQLSKILLITNHHFPKDIHESTVLVLSGNNSPYVPILKYPSSVKWFDRVTGLV